MADDRNRVLGKMLDRLFAALVNGPSLNCRPHSSRQRFDLTHLSRLRDISPSDVFRTLLDQKSCTIAAKALRPRKIEPAEARSEEQIAAERTWSEQGSVLGKVRIIAEDARAYENDTGAHVLHVGFPLLSLPPGSSPLQRNMSRRILAPLAFISVNMTLRGGASQSVVLECKNEGPDLVVPNIALLSWLERQTGRPTEELFSDEAGEEPWKEIGSIIARICKLLGLSVPATMAFEGSPSDQFQLVAAPRAEDEQAVPGILNSAVVGLFPMANQGLLRDTQMILAGEPTPGPLESFIRRDATIAVPTPEPKPQPLTPAPQPRQVDQDRLVAVADPCQAKAVRMARSCRGLVMHGPPGTGKSQTITNIVGDHLARGQRVLLVCDKRTALDVVVHRLEALGLGGLCAIVHDAQRDQRDLYKAIREQLDQLSDTRTNSTAAATLARTDAQLQHVHGELWQYHQALMARSTPQAASFHELMGKWFALPTFQLDFKDALLAGIDPNQLETHIRLIQEALERGQSVEYPTNPWCKATGLKLADFLPIPMDHIRAAMERCVSAATAADATADPAIPPFSKTANLTEHGAWRTHLAIQLREILHATDPAVLQKWAKSQPADLRRQRQRLTEVEPLIQILRAGSLDAELLLVVRANPPRLDQINRDLVSLDQYLKIAKKWYAFLCFKAKGPAAKALATFGLPLAPDSAQRAKTFLTALRARLLLSSLVCDLLGEAPATPSLISDEILDRQLTSHTRLFTFLEDLKQHPDSASLLDPITQALLNPESSESLLTGLEKSAPRAAALVNLEAATRESALFAPTWLETFAGGVRAGAASLPPLQEMSDGLATLEDILRIAQSLSTFPPPISAAISQLLAQGIDGEHGLVVMRKAILSLAIVEHLKSDPGLHDIDAQRLKTSFDRYRNLEREKKLLVRDQILDHWIGLQKTKVLASTGSRLNSVGADLRRRLTSRGQNAMRLRQVIEHGRNIEGGDPLFDLRPIWMASPETVAQLFPRLPLFDLVVFDEASQCRLEEALPVLTRAHRVVIAGDPQQLPPTRFFESAMVASENEEIETEDQLFEVQQAEIEDLLGAALNLEVEQCYLDVHYRSRNSDLIQFSNEQFYNSRLQPIPGHPANRVRFSPVTLYKANGTYEKHTNLAEADQVCKIVQDLLRRAKPPSIGIACFNLSQRDLILERLDALANEDEEFRQKLADARVRRSAASFEGLFVKNLENVQGDERDHIIISTTFGPDPSGRFYRRFGPLGRAGGGRRLNVLVTRARDEVHLVTSIPPNAYRTVPPVAPGETPSGGWLLFGYLSYAERLAEAYETVNRVLTDAAPDKNAAVNLRQSAFPSEFSSALAQRLASQNKIGSDVHWGNDGFCIDLALHHPRRIEDVTLGVMCDLTRYARAEDPVEWEIFRSTILESQGWKLHRLWTPQFFRDRQGCTEAILADMNQMLATEEDKDSIKVVDPE